MNIREEPRPPLRDQIHNLDDRANVLGVTVSDDEDVDDFLLQCRLAAGGQEAFVPGGRCQRES